jgi:Uma2 family endonuclease
VTITPIEPRTYTPAEYLELEVTSPERHEYINGEMILMTGGTPSHNRISGNLYIALIQALKRQPFEIFLLDQRLWLPERNMYTYPDVMVLGKPVSLQAGRTDTVVDPGLIAEVLSPSTQAYDRGDKFLAYRSLQSLQEYLLIDQSRIYVEHYVKTAAHQWLLTEHTDPAHTLMLNWVECQFQIADLYENVEFGN